MKFFYLRIILKNEDERGGALLDIKHLRYFIAIVENDFNLSRTAQSLYVSQPTLSIMINDFEKREGTKLFKRVNGKIVGLSFVGEVFYQDALEVIKKYNMMQVNLHQGSEQMSGNITIGIPPLVLPVVFSTIMPKMILDNPTINFSIKEKGAHVLKNDLVLQEVDLAVLLYPEGVSKHVIDSHEIQNSELALFFSPSHRLVDKETITWKDLHGEKIAIFDESFMIHHLLTNKFEQNNIFLNIILKSSSWDFMLNATKINDDLMTILPLPIADQYPSDDYVCRRIEEPIAWRVMLTRLRKSNYNSIENYIFDSMIRAFE